jgi:hypothetical protein
MPRSPKGRERRRQFPTRVNIGVRMATISQLVRKPRKRNPYFLAGRKRLRRVKNQVHLYH